MSRRFPAERWAPLADAPTPQDQRSSPAELLPDWLPETIAPVLVVIILYVAARLSDPSYLSRPLLDTPARLYYLFALALAAGLVAIERRRRAGIATEALLAEIAGAALLVGATTLLFAGHRDASALLAMAALAGVAAWLRAAPEGASAPELLPIINRLIVIGLAWILFFGIIEFHFRWLLAAPLAAAAGAISYVCYEATDEFDILNALAPLGVAALVSLEAALAVSFLNVHPAAGATLVLGSLAAARLAPTALTKGIAA